MPSGASPAPRTHDCDRTKLTGMNRCLVLQGLPACSPANPPVFADPPALDDGAVFPQLPLIGLQLRNDADIPKRQGTFRPTKKSRDWRLPFHQFTAIWLKRRLDGAQEAPLHVSAPPPAGWPGRPGAVPNGWPVSPVRDGPGPKAPKTRLSARVGASETAPIRPASSAIRKRRAVPTKAAGSG